MCGLAGIISKNTSSSQTLTSMLNSIKHRGPDDWGQYNNKKSGVYLGSRRLSIIDLSKKGKMPMFNEKKDIVVCQNGEIYNYMELKEKLTSLGHVFRSNSDTEVIVHGYEQWGIGIFKKLRGMFAAAIYDLSKDKVILARDRIGIKPLYYLTHNDSFYFSSEVKSFKKISGFSFKDNLNYDNINLLLGYMFLPKSDETIIGGVKKLLPGHLLEIRSGKIKKTKAYWKLEGADKDITFEKAVNKLDRLLSETVKSHLMSDVPLGVLLSGGLDSSLLTAYTKKLTDSKVVTFNAKFDHKFDESKYAREVAKYLDTKHEEVFIDTSDINKNIERYASTFDDLTTFDGGVITTKILCEKIKAKGITVLLLGEGADEILGGYSWFGLSQLPFSLLPASAQASFYYYAISRNITYKPSLFYGNWIKEYKQMHDKDVFRNVSRTELNIQLPNHLLMKVDKSSMAASVEARVPYLDHKVVEFVHKLPRSYKLKGRFFNGSSVNEKYILRKVAQRYLPQDIVYRKKRGFMIPMLDVLNADLNKVKDYVFSTDSISQRLIPKQKLQNLFVRDGGEIENMQKEYLLWRLFLLEVWRNTYAK